MSRHVTAKTAAPPLKTGCFDCPPAARGSDFSFGFAREDILPNDIDKKTYYIAGYGENKPAKGVLDVPRTHAAYIDDLSGHGGILLISIDNVGMLNSDVNRLRGRLKSFAMLSGCRSINIVSTHSHAGIDTMGIWGPLPLTGRNPKYMELVFSQTVKAAERAYKYRKRGKLYLGKIEVPDMQEDIRTPHVYSKALTRLRFSPNDGSRETYIINFASHSESLQGCNELVSADFPCYLRNRILEKSGAETLYCVGAIGGMITMKLPNESKIRKDSGNFAASTADIGRRIADYALSIKPQDELLLKPRLGCIRQEVYFEAENPVLLIAAKLGILKADEFKSADRQGYLMKSEISYIEIDSLKILLLPCEIFPELVYGGYLTAEESATGNGSEVNPIPLIDIIGDDAMIIGLANDEIGYVIPPNDFLLHAETPYLEKAIDAHGRRHYEETNSLGSKTAIKIAQITDEIVRNVAKVKNL